MGEKPKLTQPIWDRLRKARHILIDMARLRDELHVVVADCGNGIWEWEIRRRGQPPGADAGRPLQVA